jgi:hypothetical protein
MNIIYKLAFSAWESGLQGHPELQQETIRLYEILTEIIPSDNLAKERLPCSIGLITAGIRVFFNTYPTH